MAASAFLLLLLLAAEHQYADAFAARPLVSTPTGRSTCCTHRLYASSTNQKKGFGSGVSGTSKSKKRKMQKESKKGPIAEVDVLEMPAASAFQSPLFKEQPSIVNPDSTRWASEHNLDDRHALTHALFQQVALHLRSHTDSNGSRASCPPFLMRRNADAPIIEFNCHDLESGICSDL